MEKIAKYFDQRDLITLAIAKNPKHLAYKFLPNWSDIFAFQ